MRGPGSALSSDGLHQLGPCPPATLPLRRARVTSSLLLQRFLEILDREPKCPLVVEDEKELATSQEQILAEGPALLRPECPPCPAPPSRPLAPNPHYKKGAGGGGNGSLAGASSEPPTLDKHRDLKQSRERQPFHQERFNLLEVRSHKS